MALFPGYLPPWNEATTHGTLFSTMDVDELIKEYAAVETVAEDILSDKQQVKEDFSESTVSLASYFVSLLADC